MGIWIEKKWHLPQFMSLAQNPNRGHSPLQWSHSQKAENTFCIVQGAQSRALWWPRWWHGGRGWGRGPREREYMYAYSWFIFLYSRRTASWGPSQTIHSSWLQESGLTRRAWFWGVTCGVLICKIHPNNISSPVTQPWTGNNHSLPSSFRRPFGNNIQKGFWKQRL